MRFKEFSGEWETIELQDIAPDISSGKDKPSNDGNVVLYGSTGIVGTTKSASYTENLVLVARVGANAGLLQLTDIPCGVTDNTLVIKAKEWNKYIYYFLQHYNLNRLVFGSGQPLITGGMLKKIKIMYGAKSERNKIVQLLDRLDERITIQSKIIDRYKSLIRGINKTLLGESSFYQCLGNLCEIRKGVQVNKEELLSRGKYYVMNGGTIPSGYYNQYNTDANTISISEGGNSCGYVQYNESPFWSGGHCYTLEKVSDDVDNKYLFFYLKANEQLIMSLRIGSGLPNIQKKDLLDFRIPIPTLNNQLSIVHVLNILYGKINTERNLTSKYQQQKQYLLRQMFI